jgi:hypothetical protein
VNDFIGHEIEMIHALPLSWVKSNLRGVAVYRCILLIIDYEAGNWCYECGDSAGGLS